MGKDSVVLNQATRWLMSCGTVLKHFGGYRLSFHVAVCAWSQYQEVGIVSHVARPARPRDRVWLNSKRLNSMHTRLALFESHSEWNLSTEMEPLLAIHIRTPSSRWRPVLYQIFFLGSGGHNVLFQVRWHLVLTFSQVVILNVCQLGGYVHHDQSCNVLVVIKN